MMWFAILAALMAGAALAFVLWPLLRRRARGLPVALAIVLAFALPMTALGLYALVGTPAALNPDAVKSAARPQVDLAAAVEQLQQRLEKNPDDLEGWSLLARARQAMDQPAKAVQAWERAVQLAPDNADVLVASAEARSLTTREHTVDASSRARLEQALKIDPRQQRGLWLLGISDFQQGRYAEAAATWQRLLAQVDAQANPKVAEAIRQQIQRARQAAMMPPSADSAASEAAAADRNKAASIHVHVSLAPDLARLADPSATVFVFARAADGPPMPLAVKRLTAAELPADISLTDAMAMTPQLKLSMFDKVTVSARISASGQADPQAGDLEAANKTISVKDKQPVTLTIDHPVGK